MQPKHNRNNVRAALISLSQVLHFLFGFIKALYMYTFRCSLCIKYSLISQSSALQFCDPLASRQLIVIWCVSKDTAWSGQLFLDLGKLGVDLRHCIALGARKKQAESIVIRVIDNWLNMVVQRVGLMDAVCTVLCELSVIDVFNEVATCAPNRLCVVCRVPTVK